jgi:hypothetical protein
MAMNRKLFIHGMIVWYILKEDRRTIMKQRRILPALIISFLAFSSLPAAYGDTPPPEQSELSRRCPAHAYEFDDPFKIADAGPTQGEGDKKNNELPSLGDYAKGFIPNIVQGTKRIFSKDNIPLAAIGFGTAALALTIDHRVSDHYKTETTLSSSMMKIANQAGKGYWEIGLGAALAGTGELIKDKRMADAGIVSLEAFIINGAATEGLKLATKRKRPNQGNTMSFPAGHASVTAAFSASISEMYDWDPRLSVPLYLATAVVGFSRIQAREHYPSDVIAGITLGTLVGVSVGRYHKEGDEKSSMRIVSFTPVFDDGVRGGILTLRW